MSQSQSEADKRNSQQQFHSKIAGLLLNALRSAEKWISKQTTNTLMQRIDNISDLDSALQQIEYFMFVLLNHIEIFTQSASITVEKEDYHTLETAVQKAQAEIRSHVRIEQQLKIYAEGIEQRVEELENQLELQNQKYQKLYETAKYLDLEKKDLRKKIKMYELKIKSIQEKVQGNPYQKNSKFSESSFHCSQSSIEKIYLDKGRTRVKQFLNQSSDKKYRKQGGSELLDPRKNKRLNSEIDVNEVHLQSKKEEGITEPPKQMTQTVRLKEIYRKNQTKSGKYLKNSTEETGKRRETRSNSVCS